MTANKVIQYDNPPIGCYFDGAHGQQHNDIRVLKLAISYGWEDKEAKASINELAIDALTDNQQDFLVEVVDNATEYLNSLETRPFLYWGWQDGDFGLWPDIEAVRENVGFVSHSAKNHIEKCDPDDPGYPAADYRGKWLHINDHGNCTLYVREGNGQDREIWSVV